jgi:aldehyde dehydrogenase (NAD+)
MANATEAPQEQGRSYDRLLIGGRWVKPASDRTIEVVSPITEERIASVPEAAEADMDAAVAAARKAFDHGPWPTMAPSERAAALRRVRDEIAVRLEDMIATFTAEIGAPTELSQTFHQRALDIWENNARWLEEFAFEERRPGIEEEVTVIHEPIGVVATIIPWNGPVTTASLKIAPALAAGCTVVLKPAPEGPITMMMMAEALAAADLPEGVISVLPAGREVGEHLVRNPGVDKVSFTGSTVAGKKIMSICGERIARVTLELGGKSAAIIADDVDLDDVLPTLVPAGVGHTGQVCAALTRILVPREREDEAVAAIAAQLDAMKVGDPAEPGVEIGPLAAERQRVRVEGYIEAGLEEGARLVTGGGRPDGLDRGWYVEPTLFAGVDNSMRIAREEIFGPVLVVIPFDSLDEAVEIANDTQYGLSGAVFAKDTELGAGVARRIRSGQVSLNSWDICLVQPFGGYKQSGLGREGGTEGIVAHLETKVLQGV